MKTIEKPERIYNVSATQFSIARHYGGCKVNGVNYQYDAASDTLIREDVHKAEMQAIAERLKKRKAVLKAAQQAFTEF